MPIYEYCCKKCNKVFEEWLKDFDVESMPCPHCDGDGERMISMPSFILKGGGWYATEYGGRSGGEASGDGPGGPADESMSSSGGPSDAPFAGVLEKRERKPKTDAGQASTTAK